MIRHKFSLPKLSLAVATPLLLSGCIIVDADRVADVRSVSVIHAQGEADKAAGEAMRLCSKYGDGGAKLVEVNDDEGDGKVRSLYQCY
ncbi:hypothetical protein [Parvularcula sp. IMCC14364]|uniref:hypothetical protein n=1 Tax=Parvularcula sp. IMCC14364 TaxID=3067902 RepID=UPI00274046B7|nr:hypothetical protein [Parvularcula sp. IMCC14364]